MQFFFQTIIILLGSACLFSGCFRLDDNLFNQQKLTSYKLDAYTGEREISDLPQSYNVDAAKVSVFSLMSNDNGDQAKIYAIYVGDISRIQTDTVIMYCHGNKDHMDFYWNREKLLANVGAKYHYGVLMIDYRGYGMSEGKSTESGMYADVNAALQWLKDHGLTSDRLLMYGYSLGSAPATKLTAEPQVLTPRWLVLEAPFASAEVMVQDASALDLPASYFTNLSINNGEEIKHVHTSFCWIHGVDDDFLNINTHGEVVYANHPGPYKEPHRIPGAVHNNVPQVWGYAAYATALHSFIALH